MKDFIYEYFVEPLEDREYGIAAIVYFITILLVSCFLWLSLWLIDSMYIPEQHGEGRVIEMYYRAPYIQYTNIYVNNTTQLIPHTMPETFNIVIAIDGNVDVVRTYESDYNQTHIGDKLMCTYTEGRLFNTIYISNFYTYE